MQFKKILTSLAAAAVLAATALGVHAQTQAGQDAPGDAAVLEMQQAFRKGDRARLSALLPQAQNHPLAAWAAYWELRARLDDASSDEVQAFLQRWAGTYQEDRLRNDWLRVLGKQRDWDQFSAALPGFRMRDDREVRCYTLAIDEEHGQGAPDAGARLLADWYALGNGDDGCTYAAGALYSAGRISAQDVWRKARLAAQAGQLTAAGNAVRIVSPQSGAALRQALAGPLKYLAAGLKQGKQAAGASQELATIALVRMARSDSEQTARLLQQTWGARLTAEQRGWLWALLGQRAAMSLSDDALTYYERAGKAADLPEDMLTWKVRAALRAGRWSLVASTIDAMPEALQQDSTWQYWRARAYLADHPDAIKRERAHQLFKRIAATTGFYEQLALEEIGGQVTAPPPPPPLTKAEKAAARANPGLNRALYAIHLGLRSEGVREWHYTVKLHDNGGMDERSLLAAADLACHYEVWDRCINTSEHTRGTIDMAQRFPMPHHDLVVERARSIGLDPAYVYGLIRQESRFILAARSGVGASGLMQVMPATARWTARKIGLTGFQPDQIYERDTNITIGTAYLKLALDDFGDSLPLAAAAYNAGPGRPRNWRNGPVLDAAIWAENVPFTETRNYVKNVLANTVNYAALLTGRPQSLKQRLGTVGPRIADTPDPSAELP